MDLVIFDLVIIFIYGLISQLFRTAKTQSKIENHPGSYRDFNLSVSFFFLYCDINIITTHQ